MTKVDFYVLPEDSTVTKEQLACKLADKAYQLQHQIYIHTNSIENAKVLDDLLWTFRAGSFIPHEIFDCSAQDRQSQTSVPVCIGYDALAPTDQSDVLVNLTSEVPGFFSQFERVAEIVQGNPEQRALARERFRFYKDRGYELQTHELNR